MDVALSLVTWDIIGFFVLSGLVSLCSLRFLRTIASPIGAWFRKQGTWLMVTFFVAFPWTLVFFLLRRKLASLGAGWGAAMALFVIVGTPASVLVLALSAFAGLNFAYVKVMFDVLVIAIVFLGSMHERDDRRGDDGDEEPIDPDPGWGETVERMLRLTAVQ